MRAILFLSSLFLVTSCTRQVVGTCEVAPEEMLISLGGKLSDEQLRFYSKNYLPCKQRNKKKNPNALYNVGVAVLHGLGTDKDASKAFLWFKGAADKKHQGAQRVLADMFMQGVGVVKDPLIGQKYIEVLSHPSQGG